MSFTGIGKVKNISRREEIPGSCEIMNKYFVLNGKYTGNVQSELKVIIKQSSQTSTYILAM
jgi:hypothetical protein